LSFAVIGIKFVRTYGGNREAFKVSAQGPPPRVKRLCWHPENLQPQPRNKSFTATWLPYLFFKLAKILLFAFTQNLLISV